jgi:hypothetical protein
MTVDHHSFGLLRRSYTAAFDAYHTLATQNAALIAIDTSPSVDQLRNEQHALDALTVARRKMLEALAT